MAEAPGRRPSIKNRSFLCLIGLLTGVLQVHAWSSRNVLRPVVRFGVTAASQQVSRGTSEIPARLMGVSTPVDPSHLPPSPASVTSSSPCSLESILSLTHLPKLLVFDLDNTLWTPELYQLRQRHVPRADVDVRLFPEARSILEFLAHLQQRASASRNASSSWRPALAIASRTNKMAWAHQLLEDFVVANQPLKHRFACRLIQPGSKRKHFEQLKDIAAHRDMLFFDDDVHLNLGEVSQLGVLCCHTPRGITVEHFVKTLHHYNALKCQHQRQTTSAASATHNVWMGYVLTSQTLNIDEPQVQVGRKSHGRVKFYSPTKKFGFVVDQESGQELFVHESKIPSSMKMLQTGDQVIFQAIQEASGRASAVLLNFAEENSKVSKKTKSFTNRTPSSSSESAASAASATASNAGGSVSHTPASPVTTSMPCFSMSQPFVALLLNKCKTVESRNNPMFTNIVPGTRVLVHCGQRDWHDTASFRQYLDDDDDDHNDPSSSMATLPKGFSKGSVVGVVTIGTTWKSTASERQSLALQRRVLAPAEGIGTYCTDVTNAQWLPKPIKMRGKPGIYQVNIPENSLPDRL